MTVRNRAAHEEDVEPALDLFVRRAVMRGGSPVGYYHVRTGSIGPAAWAPGADADAVLRAAVADARAITSRVTACPWRESRHDPIRARERSAPTLF